MFMTKKIHHVHIYAHTKKNPCSSCKQPHICPAVLSLNKSKAHNIAFKNPATKKLPYCCYNFLHQWEHSSSACCIYILTFYFPVSAREALSFLCSISYLIKQQKSKHKTQRYEKHCSRLIKTNRKIYEDIKYMKLLLKNQKANIKHIYFVPLNRLCMLKNYSPSNQIQMLT